MSAAVENVPVPEVPAAEAPVAAQAEAQAEAPKPADADVAANTQAVADNAAVEAPKPAEADIAANAAVEVEAPKPSVLEITSMAQFNALREQTPYVALQAHAVWCGPCKRMSPFFKMHAEKQSGIRDQFVFARFDIDDVPELAEKLVITSIPAFHFFEPGQDAPAAELKGAEPKPLVALIDQFATKAKESKFSTSEDF